jgi:hypothetical protein
MTPWPRQSKNYQLNDEKSKEEHSLWLMVTRRDPAAGGDGCVPAVSSASVAEGDGDRTAAAVSLRDVERARGGRDVGPGDGGAVREGLEQRADGGSSSAGAAAEGGCASADGGAGAGDGGSSRGSRGGGGGSRGF